MSDESTVKPNNEEREKLAPVAGAIIGCYVVIMLVGYFLGNFIYQIPQ